MTEEYTIGSPKIVKPWSRNSTYPSIISRVTDFFISQENVSFIVHLYVSEEMICPRALGSSALVIRTSGDTLLPTHLQIIPSRVWEGWNWQQESKGGTLFSDSIKSWESEVSRWEMSWADPFGSCLESHSACIPSLVVMSKPTRSRPKARPARLVLQR